MTFNDAIIMDAFHPGAAKFGNFINYYEFNSTESRSKLLKDDFMSYLNGFSSDIVALDVGCNIGNMTDVLYNKINAYFSKMKSVNVHMLGIDLDEILILRANEKNSNQRITYNTCNIMNTEDNQTFSCYLNHLNLNKKIFDIAFCLSITMWIHLNHGDEGLRTFLSKVASLTKYLVIEPQPWKSYKTARRRLRKLKQDDFHNFEDLKIRDNILEYIDDYLITECNMIRLARLGETCWDRPITLYENVSQV